MTFESFITQWLGKKCDFDGAYQGQCVDLFRQYCQDVLHIKQPKGVTGAADFWANYDTDPNLKLNFDKIPNTPTGVPQNGDVVLWNKKSGGGYGHVAMFISGNVNGFTSFDQNWPTLSVCTKTTHDYKNTYGWLHPKVSTTPSPIPTNDLDKILTHYNVKTADELITVIDQQLQYLNEARIDRGVLQEALKKSTDDHKTFVATILGMVNSFGNPAGLSDESLAIKDVSSLVDSVSQSQQALKDQQKIADETARRVAEEKKALTDQIVLLKQQATNLQKQLDDLQKGIGKVEEAQQTQKNKTEQINAFQDLINRLTDLFKRK